MEPKSPLFWSFHKWEIVASSNFQLEGIFPIYDSWKNFHEKYRPGYGPKLDPKWIQNP